MLKTFPTSCTSAEVKKECPITCGVCSNSGTGSTPDVRSGQFYAPMIGSKRVVEDTYLGFRLTFDMTASNAPTHVIVEEQMPEEFITAERDLILLYTTADSSNLVELITQSTRQFFKNQTLSVPSNGLLDLPVCNIGLNNNCVYPYRSYHLLHPSGQILYYIPIISEDETETPATNVRWTATTNTIRITWDPPANMRVSDSRIIAYHVNVRFEKLGNKPFASAIDERGLSNSMTAPIVVGPDIRDITLKGCYKGNKGSICIGPWTLYDIHLESIGNRFYGSITHRVETAESTYQSPPAISFLSGSESVVDLKTTSSCISIKAIPPQVHLGMVIAVRLHMFSKNKMNRTQDFRVGIETQQTPVEVLEDIRSWPYTMDICDLPVNATIAITGSFITRKGEGVWSSPPLTFFSRSGLPATVRSLEAFATQDKLQVSWFPPSPYMGNIIRYYLILYDKGDRPVLEDTISGTQLSVLVPLTEIESVAAVSITAETSAGIGKPLLASIGSKSEVSSSSKDSNLVDYSWLLILAGLAVIIGVVFAFRSASRKQRSSLDFEPLSPEWALQRTNIVVGQEIGEGAFGIINVGVYKRIAHLSCEQINVAIKRCTVSDSSARREFVEEARLMTRLCAKPHPNVIQMIGVCMEAEPLIIVMELCNQGDMRRVLQELRKATIDVVPALAQFCSDVASGMAFLSENFAFIHRDIAARNVLVHHENNRLIAKISDFGMSRLVTRDYYRKTGSSFVPVRWMAPEALQEGRFATASDVWAFGVFMWEVFSFGCLPYFEYTNAEVAEKRPTLARPRKCPTSMFEVMRLCWLEHAENRPSFADLLEKLVVLQELLSSGEQMPEDNDDDSAFKDEGVPETLASSTHCSTSASNSWRTSAPSDHLTIQLEIGEEFDI
eukprot:m.169080 g.169080  ORF g.169080 m.169080 type:complete len:896 (+) comp10362_c3_seq3:3132-5819(+)